MGGSFQKGDSVTRIAYLGIFQVVALKDTYGTVMSSTRKATFSGGRNATQREGLLLASSKEVIKRGG